MLDGKYKFTVLRVSRYGKHCVVDRLDSGGIPRPFVNKSIQQSVVRGMR